MFTPMAVYSSEVLAFNSHQKLPQIYIQRDSKRWTQFHKSIFQNEN